MRAIKLGQVVSRDQPRRKTAWFSGKFSAYAEKNSRVGSNEVMSQNPVSI